MAHPDYMWVVVLSRERYLLRGKGTGSFGVLKAALGWNSPFFFSMNFIGLD